MGNKRTPDIRFAGFTGEWKLRRLGEISEKVTEKNKNNIYSETLTNSAEYGIINQRDFFDKDISNEKNLDGYYVVHPDDFVYNPRISNLAPVGPIKRNKLGRIGVMSPLYYVFRTHDVDKAYLEKYFSSNSWHIFMKLNGDSGARSDRFAIKDSIFREMPIPTPSIEEQFKIGDFFEQLDNNITLHQQELTTLKQTKQGFLQKMFPKEGESVPEVRFPGFSGEWELQKFKDLAGVRRGLTYSPANIRDNGVRVLRSSNINEDTFVLRNDDVFVDPQAINIDFVKENDILITAANGSSRLVGKHALIKNVGKNTVHGGFMLVATAKVPYFVNAMMGSIWYSKFINVYASGGNGAIGNLNKNALEEQIVLVPELEEQKKIGEFFKKIDETIALHERELGSLKKTKKAFLQKMFV
ncbi:restriction endonuclease subunit S [Cytobacillus oceanisediminis]|uniref:restriction endonuclease subunit S n=1 Tax=Cytobacillus oceanisediminis TaxID=665099 RepID=UPI002495735D|nr:restriction endonuclease subunit S [Cytobacillus oceanisediminis]